jgi:hypothetical protein
MTAHFPGLVQALVDNIYKFFECCACVVGGYIQTSHQPCNMCLPFVLDFKITCNNELLCIYTGISHAICAVVLERRGFVGTHKDEKKKIL